MKIELYQKEHCPYSSKVRHFIDEHQLRSRLEYRFIDHNGMALAKLRELTGKQTVPVLVVDGKPIPETDRIIAWLDDNLVRRSHAA